MTQPILFKDIDEPGLATLDVYQRRGGYQAARKALGMTRDQVIAELEASGLRAAW
jgi:NADH-quinone oxidoreductase subunit F